MTIRKVTSFFFSRKLIADVNNQNNDVNDENPIRLDGTNH